MAGKRQRRGNGEGSITLAKGKEGKPNRWVARLTLPDGRWKALYGKTRQEAAQRLTAALRERDLGFPLVGEKQTVGKYLTSWLETTKHTVEASTWERYEGDMRLHLIPALGKVRLAALTPQQVQKLLADKLNAGSAPRSVRNIRAVLRRALNEALALGLVTRNAAALVRAPKPHAGRYTSTTPSRSASSATPPARIAWVP